MTTTAERHLQAMKQSFQPGKAQGLKVTYRLQVTGTGGGIWTIRIANGRCDISEDSLSTADASILISGENFLRLASGDLDVRTAYQQKQLQVEGDPKLALKFTELFPPWADKLSAKAPATGRPAQPAPKTEPDRPTPTKPASPTPTQPAPTTPTTPPQAPPKTRPAAPSTPVSPTPPAAATPTLADYVAAMPRGLRADKARGTRVTYQFQLSGGGGGTWTVKVADGQASVTPGAGSANVTIAMSGSDYIRLAQGKLNTTQAYQQGKLSISGDLNLAAKITDIFGPWAGAPAEESAPTPTPAPAPEAKPKPAPVQPPASIPAPTGPTNPQLLNGSFDEYQPFVYKGEAKVWKESQFPEQSGKYWKLETHDVGKGRYHAMQSGVFGKFTQKYFRGGGRDYHIHGHHSQVFTSRYSFKITLAQTIAAQPGRDYTFSGSIVSFYKGTAGERADGKIFKSIGIDPTGGQEYYGSSVVWSPQDGKDNEWRYPSIKVEAQAEAITVFILLENIERDVGETELNIIHLDNFKLE
jgi:putative sterol carrier protein